jgi:CelD/BcsL family acetyltransferase involved in cellulose biosynthesis
MLAGELIDDLGRAQALYAEWDALAVANRLPTMAPAWILGWWKHLAPAGAAPRIVVVRDGERVVGVAPFFVEPAARGRVDYRLPGIELAVRLAPLALAGREWAVAQTIGSVLAQAQPRPDLIALEGVPVASHWPAALRAGWPGVLRPATRMYATQGCPTVSLEGLTYESWLAAKSAHFREKMRKTRRRFEQAGGSYRFTTRESLEADVATLVALHTKRWRSLGDSNLVGFGDRVPALFEEVGRLLLDEGRFRLMLLEIDGQTMCAYLALAAGGEVLGMNGGWDEQWARFSPTVVHTLYLIEDAILRGDRRIDLGLGDQSYKLRVADGNDPVGWAVLVAPGPRAPLTALRTGPMLAYQMSRHAAKRVLSDEQIARVRGLKSRPRRLRGAGSDARS